MYRAAFAVLALALASCTTFTVAPDSPRSHPRAVLLDGVVALMSGGSAYCAGVFVDKWVVTAAHCVASNRTPLINVHGSDQASIAPVVYYDEAADLAILSPQRALPHRPAPLAPYTPHPGDSVVAVGHPLGLAWYISEGVCNGIRDSAFDKQPYLYHSAPISPGNSGGPVFNEWGEVVGINSFFISGPGLGAQSHLVGAVPLDAIRDALTSL